MIRWWRARKPALLLTPKVSLLKQGNVCIPLSSLKELTQYKLSGLDVFIDGFSQSYITGSLPLVGFFDQRSAVYHKLSRDFKKSTVFGGRFIKEENSLLYHGYGFEETHNLTKHLQALLELNISVASIQSLVFTSASTLFPYCLSQIGSQSLLWISRYLGSGYRLVFYHDNAIKFARTVTVHETDQSKGTKDILQTLTYIQNEYNIHTHDLAIFLTFFTVVELKVLSHLFQRSRVYQWEIASITTKQDASVAMESWLLAYAKHSRRIFSRFISQSLLTFIIQKTRWYETAMFSLKALCVVLGVLIACGTVNLWRLKYQLYVAERVLEKEEAQVIQFKKQLQMPLNIEVPKFYRYLASQKYPPLEHDPFALIAIVAEQLSPSILIRELLWQKEPKPTLKLAIKCANGIENKMEILNRFKINLLKTLKQKSKRNIKMNQSSAEIMEINLS
jgi:hypothetical protein